MSERDFCYWLQGYFEIHGKGAGLNAEQVEMVRRHLHLVFHHCIDPQYPGAPEELQAIHDGLSGKPTLPDGVTARC